MKKLFLLMTGIYVLALISFKKPGDNNFSFAEVIKNDPSKIEELLAVADSVSRKEIRPNTIDTGDIRDQKALEEFRKRGTGVVFKTKGRNFPVIKVSMQDIMAIIDPQMTSLNVDSTDSLTFYLGTYKDNGNWVSRYNARNGGHGHVNFNELERRPAFLIGVDRTKKLPAGASSTSPSLLAPVYYDISRICPPPTSGGCE